MARRRGAQPGGMARGGAGGEQGLWHASPPSTWPAYGSVPRRRARRPAPACPHRTARHTGGQQRGIVPRQHGAHQRSYGFPRSCRLPRPPSSQTVWCPSSPTPRSDQRESRDKQERERRPQATYGLSPEEKWGCPFYGILTAGPETTRQKPPVVPPRPVAGRSSTVLPGAKTFRRALRCQSLMTHPVPQDYFPRLPVSVLPEVPQVVGPAPCLLASRGDQLGGQLGRRACDVLIIDPPPLQGVRRAWGQGRGHLAGRQRRGTGTVPVLQRCGAPPHAVQRALAAGAGGEDRGGRAPPLPLFQAAPSLEERANVMPPGQAAGPAAARGIERCSPGAPPCCPLAPVSRRARPPCLTLEHRPGLF